MQLFKAGVWPGSLVLNFTLNTSANTDCFRLSCCCVVQQFIRASQAFGMVPYMLMSLVVLTFDQTYTLRAWIQTFNIVIIFLRFSGCKMQFRETSVNCTWKVLKLGSGILLSITFRLGPNQPNTLSSRD